MSCSRKCLRSEASPLLYELYPIQTRNFCRCSFFKKNSQFIFLSNLFNLIFSDFFYFCFFPFTILLRNLYFTSLCFASMFRFSLLCLSLDDACQFTSFFFSCIESQINTIYLRKRTSIRAVQLSIEHCCCTLFFKSTWIFFCNFSRLGMLSYSQATSTGNGET